MKLEKLLKKEFKNWNIKPVFPDCYCKECKKNMKTNKQTAKERFENLFCDAYGELHNDTGHRIDRKIWNWHIQELKKLEKEVEGMKVDLKDRFYGQSEIEWGFETTHNTAIDKVLNLVRKRI